MDPVARARLSHSHSAWEFTASWAEARAVRGHVPSVWGDSHCPAGPSQAQRLEGKPPYLAVPSGGGTQREPRGKGTGLGREA